MLDPRFQAVIFDMDGTLTRPMLRFAEIAAEIGVSQPLLEGIRSLPDGPVQERAWTILDNHEKQAADFSELNDDVLETLAFLAERKVPAALLTRNSRDAVRRVLTKHALSFSAVVTREDALPKPHPQGLWTICGRLRVRPSQTLMVGDFGLDILTGRSAGASTVLLTNGNPDPDLEALKPDYIIRRLGELSGLFS